MFWDFTPLSFCKNNQDADVLYEAISKVMAYALNLNNIACIESGLHGLRHILSEYKQARDIIELFIKSNKNIDPRLVKYV